MNDNKELTNQNEDVCVACGANPCTCDPCTCDPNECKVCAEKANVESDCCCHSGCCHSDNCLADNCSADNCSAEGEQVEVAMTLEERKQAEKEQRRQEKKEKREQRLREKEEKARQIPDMKWYVVHTYSGFEQKARESLQERFKTKGLENYLGEIKIPQETVTEVVKGEKKKSTRKFFPGYILVQLRLNQDTWHMVKDTPKILGFVGDASNPAPLLDSDVELINTQVEEGGTSSRSKMEFEQGETVKVIDGPFTEFTGTIEEVKPDKGKLKVLISIFGRATPVELDYVQVEKC